MHGFITLRPNFTNANRENTKTSPVCIFPSSCLCLYITHKEFILLARIIFDWRIRDAEWHIHTEW